MSNPDGLKNYIELATKTAPKDDHINLDSEVKGSSSLVLKGALENAIKALEHLDMVKKALYYGKPGPENIQDGQVPVNTFDPAILHGAIGFATEGGELLELMYATLFGEAEFDSVNLLEECGDGFWYLALLARRNGATFTQIQATNIAKLQARFPDGFKPEDAIDRNLIIERDILEQHGNNNDN